MKKLIIANQKTYLNKTSVKEFINNFKYAQDIIICPSFPFISEYSNYLLGAQDISEEETNTQTGEITGTQLKSLNCRYVIVGHSERRAKQGESDELIKKKLINAQNSDLVPILCVGENKEEYEAKITDEVLGKQLSAALDNIEGELIIAYEPIWAIGTGLIPSNKEIYYVVQKIKAKYPQYKVLYGGSVNVNNINELIQIENVDGYLIGGASSDAEELNLIVKSCQ